VTAAALATMDVLQNDGVLDNCVEMGAYLRSCLEQLGTRYSWCGEVRGRGLILGLQLDVEGAPLVQDALKRGLLINCTAGKVLRFVPPLIVNRGEIDHAMEILDQVFAEFSGV
ncbi:MAG: aminotransferase class III-fold pyridoxal phosphate-dependent enzyme, partial [Geobacteraceae bacterium]|nr:aminotransferase class III-fold pyridoxal phosphate-dependent enzyme [Geobacteraceae bacterium]